MKTVWHVKDRKRLNMLKIEKEHVKDKKKAKHVKDR